MSSNPIEYLKTNRDTLLTDLNNFLSIPSVSTDSSFKKQMYEAARFVQEHIESIGYQKAEI